MITASSIGVGGWLCFPVAAACTAGIVHVAPGVMARYMAAYGEPHCTREVRCVIPPREFGPGGMFYRGGYPAGEMMPGFPYGGIGGGEFGAAGFGSGGAEGGRHRRHHHPETPVAAAPDTPVATPVDTAPIVGAAPLFQPVSTTPDTLIFPAFPFVGPLPVLAKPVPEPAGIAVFGVALVVLGWVKSRRKAR